MYLYLLLLLLALLVAGIVALLHRHQLRSRREVVDRTAPLAAIDLSGLDSANKEPLVAAAAGDQPESTDAREPAVLEGWQEQVRRLREQGNDEAALGACRQLFPRIQAFQQAAIILRHLVKLRLEANHGVAKELRELYRIAVMADLYRNSNPVKPRDPRRTLQQLLQQEFDYNAIGTRQLRLLTQSDTRRFEQLWGRPLQHRHAEDCPRIRWNDLCQ